MATEKSLGILVTLPGKKGSVGHRFNQGRDDSVELWYPRCEMRDPAIGTSMPKASLLATLIVSTALSGCLPGSVRTPDGRDAFVVTCDKLQECMERARSRCAAYRYKSPVNSPPGFKVWSGEVKRKFWAWEIVDNTGTWSDSGSLSMVVHKDEDGKPIHEGVRLAIYCSE